MGVYDVTEYMPDICVALGPTNSSTRSRPPNTVKTRQWDVEFLDVTLPLGVTSAVLRRFLMLAEAPRPAARLGLILWVWFLGPEGSLLLSTCPALTPGPLPSSRGGEE